MEKLHIFVENTVYPSIEFAASLSQQIDWSDENSKEAEICSVCYAAVDLKAHLCEILNTTDIEFTTVFPKSGSVIVMGKTARKLLENTDYNARQYEEMSNEGVYVKSCVMQGTKCLLLAGKSRSAMMYAAFVYLEHLGVRWYSPGEKGKHIPKLESLPTENISLMISPSYKTRGAYGQFVNDDSNEFLDWMMHNRLNFASLGKVSRPSELKKRGVNICDGGHKVLNLCLNPSEEYPYNHPYKTNCEKPSDPYKLSDSAIKPKGDEVLTYYMAHPEWYGYIDGKRSANVGAGTQEGFGDNICTSNEDAINELCKNIVNSLSFGEFKNVDYFNFWMLDNGKWCECDKCLKSGNYTHRLITIVYQVDKMIKQAKLDGKIKRDIKIMFPVYHETLPPPDREIPSDFDYKTCVAIYFPIERCYVHTLDDKTCTETNAGLMKRLESWSTDPNRLYKGEIFVGEYYNVSSFAQMCVCHKEILRKEIPMYHSMGARHLFYMHMSTQDWACNTLLNYQLYQMLWNINLDVDLMFEEYLKNYYQGLAENMRVFYSLLEQATSNMKYLKHYQFTFDDELNPKKYCLNSSLNLGKETMEELFPLKHIQFDTRVDDLNAGVSMVETLSLLTKCRETLDEALMFVDDVRLEEIMWEEDMRFTYTQNMISMMYYMTRSCLQHGKGNVSLAKSEFEKVMMYAEKLEKTTFPTRNSIRLSHLNNGLRCTWIERAYLYYKQLYAM